ncbi:LuxR C-terminal-related transcriptional regulator [Microbacterium sp. A196]|uniref:LuxR C-terminal-related transcriptional regulator n=1 Tax=Microbacterium sp. A196 TaxID=3457320 RepID=UPI003FD51A72
MASWVQQRRDDVPTFWIALDENSGTNDSFWHRVVTSVVAQRGSTEPDQLNAFLSGTIDVSMVPGLLVEALFAFGERVRVVLDDLHLLADNAQTKLIWVLERAPMLELVATARSRTRLEDPLVATRLDVGAIGSDELAFTFDEIAELAPEVTSRLLPDELHVLHDVTRGHALATRLALTALRDRSPGASSAERSEIVSAVSAFAARELLPTFADVEHEQVARLVALSPEVDAPLAAALSGRDDAWSLVQDFERDGLGRFYSRSGRRIFAFHSLVAASLTRQLLTELDDTEIRRARSVAASRLSAWGDPVDVIRLLLAAGRDEDVWPFFTENFSELSQHRNAEVIHLLDTVPLERLEQHGTLAISHAVMLSESEARPSRRLQHLVDIGIRQLSTRAPAANPSDRLLVLIARFAGLRATRRYEEAAIVGDDIVDHVAAMGAEPRARVGSTVHVGLQQVLITKMLAGHIDTAIAVGYILDEDPHPGRTRHRRSLLAYAHAVRGEMPTAGELLGSISPEYLEAWSRSLYGVGWNIASAIVHLERGDPSDALQALDPFENGGLVVEHWPTILWVRALIRLTTDDAAAGLDELTLGLRDHHGRPASAILTSRLRAIHADLATATGDLRTARRVLDEAQPLPATILARARLHLATQHPERAIALLPVERNADAAPPRELAERLLVSAVAHKRLGNAGGARELAYRAIHVLQRYRLVSPLAFIPRFELGELLSDANRDVLDAALGDPFAALATHDPLTPRERIVLTELLTTESIPQIAARLHVSPNTIKSQLRTLYRRLGASDRSDAVRLALERGLI